MAASFFRKAALEKLSTPEKLDQLITVTSPKSWIALATIVLALGVGITWSLLGTVKTKLNVVGVLLGGEIHEVVATSQGQLITLDVSIGDWIKKGDVIATIEQPELFQQIEEAKASLLEREFELQQLLAYGYKDSRMHNKILEKEYLVIGLQLESEKRNLHFLKNKLEKEKELLKYGLITESQIVNIKQEIEVMERSIETSKAMKIVQTNSQLNLDFDRQQKITLSKQRVEEEERRLKHLKERYETQTNVRSSYAGEVIELLSDIGIMVKQGTPLFKLKNQNSIADKKLKGVLYIPSQDGKKIKEGMEALVVPSTVQPEEYGYIRGKVTYVSDFPITQKGMMMTVKNDQLVSGLLSQGALFEVYVEFEKDEKAYSGFKWTSAKGPEIAINEGTSCLGKITVDKEPPATMVVPALKKFFDLY